MSTELQNLLTELSSFTTKKEIKKFAKKHGLTVEGSKKKEMRKSLTVQLEEKYASNEEEDEEELTLEFYKEIDGTAIYKDKDGKLYTEDGDEVELEEEVVEEEVVVEEQEQEAVEEEEEVVEEQEPEQEVVEEEEEVVEEQEHEHEQEQEEEVVEEEEVEEEEQQHEHEQEQEEEVVEEEEVEEEEQQQEASTYELVVTEEQSQEETDVKEVCMAPSNTVELEDSEEEYVEVEEEEEEEDNTMETLSTFQNQLTDMVSSLVNEKNHLKTVLHKTQLSVEELTEELTDLQSTFKTTEGKLSETNMILYDEQTKNTELTTTVEELTTQKTDLQTLFEKLQQELEQSKQENEKLKNENEELRKQIPVKLETTSMSVQTEEVKPPQQVKTLKTSTKKCRIKSCQNMTDVKFCKTCQGKIDSGKIKLKSKN